MAFYTDLKLEGSILMAFRASFLRRHVVIFNVRTVHPNRIDDTAEHDAFEYDARLFLASPLHRDTVVPALVSSIACLSGADAIARFWGDRVRHHVECAIATYASYGPLRHGGVRFNIEFHAFRPSVPLAAPREMIDGVLVVGGTGGCKASPRLKRVKYDEDGGLFREKNCPICFEKFERTGEDLTQMRCSHSFHHACLLKWFERNPSCPLCRQGIHI